MSLLVASMLGWLSGCSGTPTETDGTATAPAEHSAENVDVDIPTAPYKWDDSKGDASVSAEMGGPGFTGEGWSTNLEVSALGNPDAPQGGSLSQYMPDWPATLRLAGKDWNSWVNFHIGTVVAMTLLDLDPVTLEYVPALATHWQISEDGSTYRFRINPAARWSDGEPIVADDVVATYNLRMDEGLLSPTDILTYGKLHPPTAVSKYIVEIKAKEKNWRNFYYFARQIIFPAHVITKMDGAGFRDTFQFAYPPMSGPYVVHEEDIKTNQSVTLTRNRDWWGNDNPAYKGRYNLEKLEFVVVKDPNLVYEKTKKGELDYFVIPKAQWYAQELPEFDAVQRGLLVRRKFYTHDPKGVSGIAINMTRPPLDDVRVRKALQFLFDRKTMIEKLYFDEYLEIHSYFPGGVYANPDNEPLGYDEVGAVELLEAAGWTEINDEGYRVKDGQELTFTATYRSKLTERSVTLFQEACKRAGIRIETQLLTAAAGWKNLTEKEYDLFFMNWGALLFPNPETAYRSTLATQKSNNNVTGFADPEVDAVLDAYDESEDVATRVALIRKLDGLVYKQHPYVLGWYKPSERVVYWNKYGMPEPWGAPRYGRDNGDRNITDYWWYDEEKAAQLEAALADPTLTMDIPREEVQFWNLWQEAQRAAPAAEDAPGDDTE